jgi:hypothetical protein
MKLKTACLSIFVSLVLLLSGCNLLIYTPKILLEDIFGKWVSSSIYDSKTKTFKEYTVEQYFIEISDNTRFTEVDNNNVAKTGNFVSKKINQSKISIEFTYDDNTTRTGYAFVKSKGEWAYSYLIMSYNGIELSFNINNENNYQVGHNYTSYQYGYSNNFDDREYLTIDNIDNEYIEEFNSFLPFNDVDYSLDSVVVIYMVATSGTPKYIISEVILLQDVLVVSIQDTTHSEVGTCDMSGWLFSFQISKQILKSITWVVLNY